MLRNFFVYILLLLRHVSRLAKMLGQNVDLYPCRGILIDGDHAIDWRKDGIAQSQERSVCRSPLCSLRMISLCLTSITGYATFHIRTSS